jgi:hypothetical protein
VSKPGKSLNPFLKNFLASTRPIVDAMTKEEREQFVYRIMEAGKIKEDE